LRYSACDAVATRCDGNAHRRIGEPYGFALDSTATANQ
jgi:hypothetical protein